MTDDPRDSERPDGEITGEQMAAQLAPNVRKFIKLAMIIPMLVGGVFTLVGTGLVAFWGLPTLQTARASSDWPKTTGTVITSTMESHHNSEGTSYSAHVVYRYEVLGEEFENDRIVIGGFESANRSTMHKTVRSYPEGKAVDVYYDPTDPYNATLQQGAGWSSWFPLLFGSLFTLVGTGIILGFYWAHRNADRLRFEAELADNVPST